MNKKNIVIIVLSIIIAILFAVILGMYTSNADSNSTEMQKFIGIWHPVVRPLPVDSSYNFKDDGTFIFRIDYAQHVEAEDQVRNGTYKVQDGKIILTFENSEVIIYQYIFSKNNAYLTLLDENFDATENTSIQGYTWSK